MVCGSLVLPRPWPRACSLTVFAMPVASVLTKCQEEVSRIPAVHPGTFRPQCDENGNYKPLQCYGSTGYCWCVFPNGTEVPHSRSHGHRNCSGKSACSARECQRSRKVQEGCGARSPSWRTRGPDSRAPGGSRSATPLSIHLPSRAFLTCLSIHLFSHFHSSTYSSVPLSLTCDAHAALHHPQCIRESYRPTHPVSSSPPMAFPDHAWLLPSDKSPVAGLGRMTQAPRQWVWEAGLPSDRWTCYSFAESVDVEDLSSGLGMTKPDLGQGKGSRRGHLVPSNVSPEGPDPSRMNGQCSMTLGHSPTSPGTTISHEHHL